MRCKSLKAVRATALGFSIPLLVASAVVPLSAQDAPSTQVTPTNTVPNATVDSTAKVTKDDRKAERKRQKHEENAANARARQAKADAKAKKQADKAQGQSEKAQDEAGKANTPK